MNAKTFLVILVNNITSGFDTYLMNPIDRPLFHLGVPWSKLNDDDFYVVSTKPNTPTGVGIHMEIIHHIDNTEAKCNASMTSHIFRGTYF